MEGSTVGAWGWEAGGAGASGVVSTEAQLREGLRTTRCGRSLVLHASSSSVAWDTAAIHVLCAAHVALQG
eukprot:CAMPEP_0196655182 /NCGR_PEP_ID=MMETSP1086-20130531/4926_1 /TAXON_ID=77921 /ORGANISM="Cyanoptyche  gloeocystis , Strain SAG4.97" /LENGTH=69 /DNA_ID=CAMNT_0041987347 /DNA_START=182 /DNA_END=392 /DNA_ORIENTATION=-